MLDTILIFGGKPWKKIGYATVLHVSSITCVWRFHTKLSNSFLQMTDVYKIKGATSILQMSCSEEEESKQEKHLSSLSKKLCFYFRFLYFLN